eukprot:TRINITY_DN32712_c0_g1_i1.p1 TRINITY_DN32712_c0_g1~~TRINITY_DN32712_c0_g1_i1.p1  ORF type:complete len:153 (-),score=29.70 TRINITY_DN32712_c0_g1_i1:26-484(-)
MGLDQGRPPYQAPSMERDDGRAPPRDPRTRDPRDRGGSAGPQARGPPNPGMGGQGMRPPGGGGRGGPQLPPHLAGADPEKAQLIMQVLQLTDEQIAVLPAEQRQSIMVLKEQIKQGPQDEQIIQSRCYLHYYLNHSFPPLPYLLRKTVKKKN